MNLDYFNGCLTLYFSNTRIQLYHAYIKYSKRHGIQHVKVDLDTIITVMYSKEYIGFGIRILGFGFGIDHSNEENIYE